MVKLSAVNFDVDPTEITKTSGKLLFRCATVDWSTPKRLGKKGAIVFDDDNWLKPGYLYIVTRDHGNSAESDRICYVGITNDLNKRFKNHPTVDELRGISGPTKLSIGEPSFVGSHLGAGKKHRLAIEELEHLYIWTLWQDLWNANKQFTVPGMGKNAGQAWDITNTGYEFSGRMPSRIVYPWIALQPRRNRTQKVG